MRVRHGWSGEVRPNVWVKVSVDLEEEDLRRIIVTAGLPESLIPDLTVPDVYRILEAEAERLVLVKLVARYDYPIEPGRLQLVSLADAVKQVLDRLTAAQA